jgi:hypothetical protein
MSTLLDQGYRYMPEGADASCAVAEIAVDFQKAAKAFVDAAERALATSGASGVASDDLEPVITTAIKLYAAKAEAEGTFPAPVAVAKVTPTEVVLVVSEMLRAVNISLFDLAMWYRRGGQS